MLPGHLSLLKSPNASKSLAIKGGRSVADMLGFNSDSSSWIACRFRSRADLELEVIAPRHQLAVLRRQRPGRARLSTVDRLIWVWLYRVWPRCLSVIVLVKPATVVRWHRHGFRLYWPRALLRAVQISSPWKRNDPYGPPDLDVDDRRRTSFCLRDFLPEKGNARQSAEACAK